MNENDWWLIVAVAICLVIAMLVAALMIASSPDEIIYEFAYDDEVVSFIVSAVVDNTDTYYTFLLTDGTKITYYPKEGAIVTKTEIRY